MGILAVFKHFFKLMGRHWRLTIIMARREITDRFAGQLLGPLWALMHPLILIVVYVFVFGVVFRVRIEGNTGLPDYTTYLLSGLIPWIALTEVLSKSAVAITANANLVKQVVFPVDILPLKGALSALFTQAILLTLLMGYVFLWLHLGSWIYLLLPLLLILQALMVIGLAFMVAAIGVYFRDVKDLVQVFALIGIYLVPAFYLPRAVPGQFRALLYINPFSYMVWCFQDVLYFGRMAHPWAWVIFTGMSVLIFVSGYRVFDRLKTMFGNLL